MRRWRNDENKHKIEGGNDWKAWFWLLGTQKRTTMKRHEKVHVKKDKYGEKSLLRWDWHIRENGNNDKNKKTNIDHIKKTHYKSIQTWKIIRKRNETLKAHEAKRVSKHEEEYSGRFPVNRHKIHENC